MTRSTGGRPTWARWLDAGLDVYAYFDNDVKVRAPVDAMGLRARLAGRSA